MSTNTKSSRAGSSAPATLSRTKLADACTARPRWRRVGQSVENEPQHTKPGTRSFSRSRALARQSRREVRNERLWPRAVVRRPLRAVAPGPPRRQVVPEHLRDSRLPIELQLAARLRLTLVDIAPVLQHDLAPSAASRRHLPLSRRRRRLERPATEPTRTAEPLSSDGKRRRAAPPARDRAATATS